MIFKDKTVIITGASEGIGAATARLFAEAGANLMLVARSRKNLEAIAEELRDKTRVEIFPMDVTDADACVDVFKKAAFEFGHVDILVNNAGFHARGPVRDVAATDLGRIIDVNLKAPIMLTRIALPYLEEAGEGVIVNVASLHGKLASAGASTGGEAVREGGSVVALGCQVSPHRKPTKPTSVASATRLKAATASRLHHPVALPPA